MYLYKLEVDEKGIPYAMSIFFKNTENKETEVIFERILELKNGISIETVHKVEVKIEGNKISKNSPEYKIPEGIFQKIRRLAVEKLIWEKDKFIKFVCPNCGYIDPETIELIQAGRENEIERIKCKKCKKEYRIKSNIIYKR